MNTDAGSSTHRRAGHALVVFAGNVTGTGLGFLASVLIMLALGPKGFGIVFVATTFLTVLWQLTGRGLDQALVRCVALLGRGDPAKGLAVRQTVHQIKLVLGGGLVLVGLALSAPISRFFIGPDLSATPLYVAAVGALAASMWGYTGACLQAEERFMQLTLVRVVNGVTRILFIAVLYVSGTMTAGLAMLAAAAGYAVAAALGYVLVPAAARHFHGQAELRPIIYASSRWLVISSVIYLLYTRVDQLMISRMVGMAAAGIYAAAATFIQLVDLLSASLLTVFLPRACEQTDVSALRRHLWTSLRVSAMLAVPLVLLLPVAPPVMGWLLGSEYALSILIFLVIYSGAVFNVITHPMQVVLHARGKTHLLTILDVVVLAANLIANYLAIGSYGIMGAAVVALLTRFLSGGLLVILVVRELRSTNATEGNRP